MRKENKRYIIPIGLEQAGLLTGLPAITTYPPVNHATEIILGCLEARDSISLE